MVVAVRVYGINLQAGFSFVHIGAEYSVLCTVLVGSTDIDNVQFTSHEEVCTQFILNIYLRECKCSGIKDIKELEKRLRYGMDGIGVEVRFQAGAGLLSFLHNIKTGSETHSMCVFGRAT